MFFFAGSGEVGRMQQPGMRTEARRTHECVFVCANVCMWGAAVSVGEHRGVSRWLSSQPRLYLRGSRPAANQRVASFITRKDILLLAAATGDAFTCRSFIWQLCELTCNFLVVLWCFLYIWHVTTSVKYNTVLHLIRTIMKHQRLC